MKVSNNQKKQNKNISKLRSTILDNKKAKKHLGEAPLSNKTY
jgi:hypothetical protein